MVTFDYLQYPDKYIGLGICILRKFSLASIWSNEEVIRKLTVRVQWVIVQDFKFYRLNDRDNPRAEYRLSGL